MLYAYDVCIVSRSPCGPAYIMNVVLEVHPLFAVIVSAKTIEIIVYLDRIQLGR